MTNLVYFGSPEFSATILESIIRDLSDIKVVAIVTNPDRLVGRKQVLTSSPVAMVAEKHHLPCFKPEHLDSANLAHLKLLKPDIFLTVAFGKIIPPNWLSAPKIKSLNLHFSLLPKYRGALCIQEALKNGDDATGVTLMEMSTRLDAGPIISQSKINIEINDNIASLQTKLTQVGTELLKRSLPEYLSGTLSPTPQDESDAVYTPSLKTVNRDSAFIPWETLKSAQSGNDAFVLHNLIRSLNPEPGAWTKIKDQDLKILSTHLEDKNSPLTIEMVQLSGKSPVTWKEFRGGHEL